MGPCLAEGINLWDATEHSLGHLSVTGPYQVWAQGFLRLAALGAYCSVYSEVMSAGFTGKIDRSLVQHDYHVSVVAINKHSQT